LKEFYFTNDNIPFYFKQRNFIKNYTILIDTKNGLLEVAGNLCHATEHNRVIREVELAKKLGCRSFIFLIGEDDVKTKEDVINWSSSHTKVKGLTLLKVMNTFSKHHGCKFIIVPKNEMGIKIIQFLS